MDGNGATRLNGWKDIANHLDVTVRTAQPIGRLRIAAVVTSPNGRGNFPGPSSN